MPRVATLGALAVVELDGALLPEDLATLLTRVTVDTSLHLPDMVELRLSDEHRDVLQRLGVRIGSRLLVTGTSPTDATQAELVQAEVTALEHDFNGVAGGTAVIRGYDASHRLCRGRRTASYNDVTDADVVRAVAARAGVEVGQVDQGPTSFDHVAQVNATDWDFLTARARESGFGVAVKQGRLEWRRPPHADDAPEPGVTAADLPQPFQLHLGTNLLRFRPRVTAGAQVGNVEVRSWDPAEKSAVVGRARAATTGASVALAPGELAGSFDAPDFVAVDRPVSSQAEADAAAAAIAESIASVHAEAEGVAVGDPRLVAGSAVAIGLCGWPYDGRWTLTTARHVYDERGYRVAFTVSGRQERSLLGLASGGATNSVHRAGGPPVHGVVVGIVTDVDDPAALGRVKLRFPWLDEDYESWWARVVMLGAGPSRGAVWLPEVNDEVLVAFEHGDSRRPYVVGALFNGVDKPPLGDGLIDFSSGAVKRRGFVSKAGHHLVFLDDDGKSGIAMRTADGSLKIALKQSDTTISVKADGTVEISGSQQVTVTSDGAISVQAGTTLELKASAGVTIDGGPKVAVTGSVITLN